MLSKPNESELSRIPDTNVTDSINNSANPHEHHSSQSLADASFLQRDCNNLPPKTSVNTTQLSTESINEKLSQFGFPAMQRLWNVSQKLPCLPDENDENKLIEKQSKNHTSNYFGHPKIVIPATAALTGLALLGYDSLTGISATLSRPLATTLGIMTTINATGLALLAINAFQAYIVHPFTKISARDLRFMLSKEDYRSWFDNTDKARATSDLLNAFGVSKNWDNPKYAITYQKKEANWIPIEEIAPKKLIHQTLKDFLGEKNAETRSYQEGSWSHALLDGKKSVTQFTKLCSDELRISKAQLLEEEKGIVLLEQLLNNYVKQDSRGYAYLQQTIEQLKSSDSLAQGTVRVSPWKRNPWVDLTRQKDFYSSASLREDSLVEGGSKGRLGTFGYLRNKSIVGLEFSTHKGRVVRARLGAALAETTEGKQIPVLFVDAAEGSNTLETGLIKKGIEDYAKACNFDAVLYYAHPMNKVPQRFISFLSKTQLPKIAARIEFFDADSRQYLEAFGLPVQSFEYVYPKGKVIAHTKSLTNKSVSEIFAEPTLKDKCSAFLRSNSFNIALAAAGSQALSMFALVPTDIALLAAVPTAVVVAGLGLFQAYFGRRSLRNKE